MMTILTAAPPAVRSTAGAADPSPPGARSEGFEAALEAHGPELYRYLRRLAPTAEDAADLHQETLLRGFRAYGRLDEAANVRAWLYRIASNVATDAHRRRTRRAVEAIGEEPEPSAGPSAEPEPAAEAAELRSAVREALLGLSPSQRTAVILRVFDGAEYDELERAIGCSGAAARQHVSQGLRRLRAALEEWR